MLVKNISIVIFLFLIFFVLAEFLYKRKVASYITRKVVHIGCALVAVLLPFFVDLKTVIGLGIGFFLLLIITKRKKILNSVHEIGEDSIGALLFPVGVVLTALIYWPINILIFQGSVLILGLSDGFAGLIGKRYEKNVHMIYKNKSVEGSLVFFFLTFIILIYLLNLNGTLEWSIIPLILIISLLITVAEIMFDRGWDNLFVPIVAGLLIYFIL